MQSITVLLILAGTVVLLVTRWVSVEVTSLLIIGALVATGVLTSEEALSGLASPATITVAAMFVLSAGLMRAGVLDALGSLLSRYSAGKRVRLLFLVGCTAMFSSAFINNTPIVIMMVPVMLSLARQYQIAPSKLLIPLSYFAILGGTCTLIGTSTNILVDSIYRNAGGPGFGMFDFARLGLLYTLFGGTYILLFSGRLLRDRVALSHILSTKERTSFVTEISIAPNSKLESRLYSELLPEARVRVLQLVRDEHVTLSPSLERPVKSGDTLLVEANAAVIHELLSSKDIEYASALEDSNRVRISSFNLIVAEAVVTPNSAFLGRRLGELGLNRRFGIKILAVRRLGRHHRYQLRDMRVRAGDVLLIQGEAGALASLGETQNVLIIEGMDQTLRFPAKAPMAVAIMAAVVTLAAFGVLPIAILALMGVAALLLTRCLNASEATHSLDSSVLMLLVGTIPLGVAMAKSGVAATMADSALEYVGAYGPIAILSCVYLMTTILTELMSNNAAAVLLAPIVLGIAGEAGIDPKPLLITVAFAASASFATPIGYQTNTIVMGPGGYVFSDFVRIGLPLNIILWLLATLAVPVLWPL